MIISNVLHFPKAGLLSFRKLRHHSHSRSCPLCSSPLRYRDRRKRIMKLEGGSRQVLILRRFRCTGCRKLHTELPSVLIPYKHYSAEIISGVLDRLISENDPDSEDYPCEKTMQRWRGWFAGNRSRMEGILQKALLPRSVRGGPNRRPVLLRNLSIVFRKLYPDWLERMVRIVLHNGERFSPIA